MRDLAREILGSDVPPSREVGLAVLDRILISLSEFSFAWHPLGFAHAKVWSEANLTLRLHLWPKATRRPQEPLWSIHTHAFHLESAVLVGLIENRLYLVHPKQDGSQQLYGVEYRGEGSVLLATNVFVEASEDQTQIADAGQGYEVPIGAFHSSRVPERVLAATLVRTRQHATTPPKVVGTRSGLKEYYYERAPCDTSIVRDAIGAVLQSRP